MMALSTIASRRFEGALAIGFVGRAYLTDPSQVSEEGTTCVSLVCALAPFGNANTPGTDLCVFPSTLDSSFAGSLASPWNPPSNGQLARRRGIPTHRWAKDARAVDPRWATVVPSIAAVRRLFHGSGRRGIPPWPWTGRNLHLSSCTRSSMDGFLDPFSPLSFLSHLATTFRRRPSRAFVSHPSMEARRRTPSWPSPVHVEGEEEARRRSPFLHSFG